MIDIHCHLLYGVDDGPASREESIMMLKEAKKQGISYIILTPHYRHGMFDYPVQKILENYQDLKIEAKKYGIGLALGTEFHVNSKAVSYFDKKRCATMANSEYVLTEYSHSTDYPYIEEKTRELLFHGYIPIIAHVERYECLTEDADRVESLRRMGALIQVNADAVIGKDGFKIKRYCKTLLREQWVDFIGSDAHGIKRRANHMKECYDYIAKKYGENYAKILMCKNPRQIFEK